MAERRSPGAAMAALVVDPVVHAGEVERFVRKVVRRPDTHPADPAAVTCAIWTGAIADDGYGRFSITCDGVEHTVKPHRYAVALALGVPVPARAVIEGTAASFVSMTSASSRAAGAARFFLVTRASSHAAGRPSRNQDDRPWPSLRRRQLPARSGCRRRSGGPRRGGRPHARTSRDPRARSTPPTPPGTARTGCTRPARS